MELLVRLIISFYGFVIIGSVVLVIYMIIKRKKEKKIESEKHKKYKDY